MSRLRGESRELSDVKELIGKIFRTKDLASAAVLWNTRGQAASPTKPEECEGRCHGSDVTGERWEREAASVPHTIAHNAIEWGTQHPAERNLENCRQHFFPTQSHRTRLSGVGRQPTFHHLQLLPSAAVAGHGEPTRPVSQDSRTSTTTVPVRGRRLRSDARTFHPLLSVPEKGDPGHSPIEWGTLELDGPPARVASGYRWLLTADSRASS